MLILFDFYYMKGKHNIIICINRLSLLLCNKIGNTCNLLIRQNGWRDWVLQEGIRMATLCHVESANHEISLLQKGPYHTASFNDKKDCGQTLLNWRPHGGPWIFCFYRTYVLRGEIKNPITWKNVYVWVETLLFSFANLIW